MIKVADSECMFVYVNCPYLKKDTYLIMCWAQHMFLYHNDPKIADIQDTQKVFYFKI